MNLEIGAKIKSLRKRDDITQEQLADALGVTYQAISKWESGNGQPDIGFILPIANFFNITIDELFNRNAAEKAAKIKAIWDEHNDLMKKEGGFMQQAQALVDLMRNALAEFPGEDGFRGALAEDLYFVWISQANYRKTIDGIEHWDYKKNKAISGWEEAVKILENLLNKPMIVSAGEREKLIDIYTRIGDDEKALEMIAKCDSLLSCQEVLLSHKMLGKNRRMYMQLCNQRLLGTLYYNFIHMSGETNDPDIIRNAYEAIIAMYKVLYSDGNFGFDTLYSIYEDYANQLIRQNRPDEALEALSHALEHAKQRDENLTKLRGMKKGEVYKYTAPMVDMLEVPPVPNEEQIVPMQTFVAGVPNKLESLLTRLKSEDNNAHKHLHKDPRYTALLEKYVN